MSEPALGTILLIEDEPTDTLLVRRAFEQAGVKNPIQSVANGDIALSYLEGIGDYRDRIRQLTGRAVDVCPCCGGQMVTIGCIPRTIITPNAAVWDSS